MTLQYIAAIIESNYYNGRVMDDDKKLDFDDFLQMARAANGSFMRDIWYDENQRGNPNLYFAGSISTERFKIKRKGRYRVIELEDGGAVKLPKGMGIMRVSPAMDGGDEENDECEDFEPHIFYSRGEPGYEQSFGEPDQLDDMGEGFYVPSGNTIRLFGFNEALYAEVDLIKNDEDLDVPESIGWQIIMSIVGPVVKESLNPVDTTDDGNPNVVTVKKRIADPQGLDGS